RAARTDARVVVVDRRNALRRLARGTLGAFAGRRIRRRHRHRHEIDIVDVFLHATARQDGAPLVARYGRERITTVRDVTETWARVTTPKGNACGHAFGDAVGQHRSDRGARRIFERADLEPRRALDETARQRHREIDLVTAEEPAPAPYSLRAAHSQQQKSE